MDFEHLFVGTALLGAAASVFWGCWSYIKTALWRVINLLVVRARFTDYAGQAISYYCWIHLKRSPFGEKEYGGFLVFVQPVGRSQAVGYESSGRDFVVFWKGWRPILLYMDYPSGNGGVTPPPAVTTVFIRGMFEGDALLVEATDLWNEKRHKGNDVGRGRFRVNRLFGRLLDRQRGGTHGGSTRDEPIRASNMEEVPSDRRYLKWSADDLGTSPGNHDPFSALALPENAMAVVERVSQWVNSETWYKKKQIPWRLGLLLYGPPGTGKSSVVRSIGQQFDMPINAFDLSTFGNEDFVHEWNNVLSSTPCIMLIEDVDATFDGRINRGGEGGLTFDCLLNCLSGVKESGGVLVIITTNHLENMDEALGKPSASQGGISTRPGRIDYVLELGPLDESCRRRIAERILEDCPEMIDELVAAGEGFTGAQFQNLCSQTALTEYWAGNGPSAADGAIRRPAPGELVWSEPESVPPGNWQNKPVR